MKTKTCFFLSPAIITHNAYENTKHNNERDQKNSTSLVDKPK